MSGGLSVAQGYTYLQAQQEVDGADDDVDGGSVPCLCPQVVLELCAQTHKHSYTQVST